MAEKGHGPIRSVTARLRNYLKGPRRLLRRGERYDARLPFVITLLRTDRVSARFLRDAPALVGYTRDVSETGLTLLLPSVRAGDAYLTNVGSSLEVKLELPGGAITMLTTSVRFEQLSRREAGCGYLLAVQIVQMKEPERARYAEYLKTLGREGKQDDESAEQAQATAAPAHVVPVGKAQLGAWDALTPASVDQAFEQFLRK